MPKTLAEVPKFEELNHTELWQMAQRLGISGASAAIPREILMDALEKLEDIDAENPIDEFRKKFSQWLMRHWDIMRMQVPEARCPDCRKSPDMVVANCWLDNRSQVT